MKTTTKQPSILDPDFVYVPAEETDIKKTFQRELAKMRSPYYESDYEEVERHHYMMFENGYER